MGKEADRICEQCGDVYCSLTWMGNTGCFAKFHSKGNRRSHSWKPFSFAEEQAKRSPKKHKKHKKDKNDKKGDKKEHKEHKEKKEKKSKNQNGSPKGEETKADPAA